MRLTYNPWTGMVYLTCSGEIVAEMNLQDYASYFGIEAAHNLADRS